MKKKQFKVNPFAETVGNYIAQAALSFFILWAVLCLIAGIYLCSEEGELGIIIIASSLIFVFVGIVIWASLKIIVNISRSLYNINNALRGEDEEQEEEFDTVEETGKEGEADVVEGSPFQKGQLVIIKRNQEQFRIDRVIKKDGMFRFLSYKFGKSYSAEEIEDFEKYWKERRK